MKSAMTATLGSESATFAQLKFQGCGHKCRGLRGVANANALGGWTSCLDKCQWQARANTCLKLLYFLFRGDILCNFALKLFCSIIRVNHINIYISYPKGRWYVTGRVRPLAGRVRVCRPSQGRSRDLSVGKPTSHDVP